ncbi:MAG: hypothetical protein EHM48_09710, partial [Planctomycetaceae bacterium]
MKRTIALCLSAVAIFIAAGIVSAQTPATTPAGAAGKVGEVGVQVQISKQQFETLVLLMNKVAENIKATDPEGSKAIQAAVAHAQEAFLANKMSEVYEALTTVKLSEAGAKTQDVEKIL